MSGLAWRFERSVRQQIQRLFRLVYNRRRIEPTSLGLIARILLVRTDKIGDAIVSTPVIAALKMQFPESQIDVLLGRRNCAAAPLLPTVNQLFCAKHGLRQTKSLLKLLRAQRYDLAINMVKADSITAAVYTIGSGARVKIGFENSASSFYDFVVPHPDPALHHVPRLLGLLAPLQILVPSTEARPSIVLSPQSLAAAQQMLADVIGDARPVVMINISGSSDIKFWGVANFARLARELEQTGVRVVLLSAPINTSLLKDIAAQSGAFYLPAVPDLMNFSALLSFAHMVVSPDTSIVHIAAALNKPVVTLVASAQTGVEWAPWGVLGRAVSCDRQISNIPYESVRNAIDSLFEEMKVSEQGHKL